MSQAELASLRPAIEAALGAIDGVTVTGFHPERWQVGGEREPLRVLVNLGLRPGPDAVATAVGDLVRRFRAAAAARSIRAGSCVPQPTYDLAHLWAIGVEVDGLPARVMASYQFRLVQFLITLDVQPDDSCPAST